MTYAKGLALATIFLLVNTISLAIAEPIVTCPPLGGLPRVDQFSQVLNAVEGESISCALTYHRGKIRPESLWLHAKSPFSVELQSDITQSAINEVCNCTPSQFETRKREDGIAAEKYKDSSLNKAVESVYLQSYKTKLFDTINKLFAFEAYMKLTPTPSRALMAYGASCNIEKMKENLNSIRQKSGCSQDLFDSRINEIFGTKSLDEAFEKINKTFTGLMENKEGDIVQCLDYGSYLLRYNLENAPVFRDNSLLKTSATRSDVDHKEIIKFYLNNMNQDTSFMNVDVQTLFRDITLNSGGVYEHAMTRLDEDKREEFIYHEMRGHVNVLAQERSERFKPFEVRENAPIFDVILRDEERVKKLDENFIQPFCKEHGCSSDNFFDQLERFISTMSYTDPTVIARALYNEENLRAFGEDVKESCEIFNPKKNNEVSEANEDDLLLGASPSPAINESPIEDLLCSQNLEKPSSTTMRTRVVPVLNKIDNGNRYVFDALIDDAKERSCQRTSEGNFSLNNTESKLEKILGTRNQTVGYLERVFDQEKLEPGTVEYEMNPFTDNSFEQQSERECWANSYRDQHANGLIDDEMMAMYDSEVGEATTARVGKISESMLFERARERIRERVVQTEPQVTPTDTTCSEGQSGCNDLVATTTPPPEPVITDEDIAREAEALRVAEADSSIVDYALNARPEEVEEMERFYDRVATGDVPPTADIPFVRRNRPDIQPFDRGDIIIEDPRRTLPSEDLVQVPFIPEEPQPSPDTPPETREPQRPYIDFGTNGENSRAGLDNRIDTTVSTDVTDSRSETRITTRTKDGIADDGTIDKIDNEISDRSRSIRELQDRISELNRGLNNPTPDSSDGGDGSISDAIRDLSREKDSLKDQINQTKQAIDVANRVNRQSGGGSNLNTARNTNPSGIRNDWGVQAPQPEGGTDRVTETSSNTETESDSTMENGEIGEEDSSKIAQGGGSAGVSDASAEGSSGGGGVASADGGTGGGGKSKKGRRPASDGEEESEDEDKDKVISYTEEFVIPHIYLAGAFEGSLKDMIFSLGLFGKRFVTLEELEDENYIVRVYDINLDLGAQGLNEDFYAKYRSDLLKKLDEHFNEKNINELLNIADTVVLVEEYEIDKSEVEIFKSKLMSKEEVYSRLQRYLK